MILRAMFLILAIVVPDASLACLAPIRMDLRDILKADAVVVGELTARRVVERNTGGTKYYVVKLTFRIDEVLAGDAPSNQTIEIIEYNKRYLERSYVVTSSYVVALERSATGASKTSDQDPLHIMQRHCVGGPFLFEKDGEIGRAVRDIFDGKGDATAEAEAYAKGLDLMGGQSIF
ncbi:hypothetical protein GGD81_003135 [Rhodobium orientis]|nr:hypothetical protein [Rhodobium orientis]MBB4304080.1 hypothetical protein [Rhodobium orientis]